MQTDTAVVFISFICHKAALLCPQPYNSHLGDYGSITP